MKPARSSSNGANKAAIERLRTGPVVKHKGREDIGYPICRAYGRWQPAYASTMWRCSRS